MQFKEWLENRYDVDGNWVGEGGLASGFLPISINTNRLCLALRSIHVDSKVNGKNVNIQCWGTIGGAAEGDPISSAKREVAEETGFTGPYLSIIPVYTFVQNDFRYQNYLAVVPNEFSYAGHSWETDAIDWVDYSILMSNESSYRGHPFHDGLKLLLGDGKTRSEISRIIQQSNKS